MRQHSADAGPGRHALAHAHPATRTKQPPAWPELDYAAGHTTWEASHLWLQIVGKYALSHSPWLNHAWHATLRVTPCGIRTQRVADAGGTEVELDLIGSELVIKLKRGQAHLRCV